MIYISCEIGSVDLKFSDPSLFFVKHSDLEGVVTINPLHSNNIKKALTRVNLYEYEIAIQLFRCDSISRLGVWE